MNRIPGHMLKKRRIESEKYLIGSGLELGALDSPLWTSHQVTVHYVDRLSVDELRCQYPNLKDLKFVDVDIIDDAETLSKIENNRQDFIIANHMLEHCENPLGAIRNHLLKVRETGILYYAIPDKRYSFDADRPLTTFDHLVRDDQDGPETSRLGHFREWSRFIEKKVTPWEIETHVKQVMEINYSIHFHVWDIFTFHQFIIKAQDYLNNNFQIEHFEQNDTEIIVILRKN